MQNILQQAVVPKILATQTARRAEVAALPGPKRR
jgi:hypothetical protein